MRKGELFILALKKTKKKTLNTHPVVHLVFVYGT